MHHGYKISLIEGTGRHVWTCVDVHTQAHGVLCIKLTYLANRFSCFSARRVAMALVMGGSQSDSGGTILLSPKPGM